MTCFVGRDAARLEQRRHVGAQAQLARAIHQVEPVEVHRAGNVTVARRGCARARCTRRRCGNPRSRVERRRDDRGCPARRRSARDRSTSRTCVGCGRTGVRSIGMPAAAHAWMPPSRYNQFVMADDVERPDETAGPTAAFVVVRDDRRVAVDSRCARTAASSRAISGNWPVAGLMPETSSPGATWTAPAMCPAA